MYNSFFLVAIADKERQIKETTRTLLLLEPQVSKNLRNVVKSLRACPEVII